MVTAVECSKRTLYGMYLALDTVNGMYKASHPVSLFPLDKNQKLKPEFWMPSKSPIL